MDVIRLTGAEARRGSMAQVRRAARDLERFGPGRVKPAVARAVKRLASRGRKYTIDTEGKRHAASYATPVRGSYEQDA